MYPASSCPVCRKRRAALEGKPGCFRCGAPFDGPAAPVGLLNNGFDHWHFGAIEDMACRTPPVEALCIDCYRKDYAQTYPDAICHA